MATPLCTSSQSHWAAPSAGWVVLSGGGRLAATGTQASRRVVACAPAPADGRRTSAPGGVSEPGVDSVEAVAAGRAALSQVAGPSWTVLAHWSAVLPAKPYTSNMSVASLSLHWARITNMDRRLSVVGSRSRWQASSTSSCASLKPTKLASMRPLGEQ